MKQHLHFHSDCPFFAGCENMLVNFFHSPEIMDTFEVTFSYRYSERYESGFLQRVRSAVQRMPLHLLDVYALELFAGKKDVSTFGRFLKFVFKALTTVFPVKYILILWNTFVLFQLFGTVHIDILHVNNGGYPGAYSCMAAVFAARLRGVKKIVYVVNNIARPYSSPSRWWDYPLDRIVVASVSRFVTGSLYAGKKLTEVLRLPHDKYVSIHNGILPRQIIESRESVRQRLGIEKDTLVVGMVAVMEERKGHRFLIEAIKILKDHGEKELPVVAIEGDGGMLSELKELVRQAGVQYEVRFIGHENNVFDFINATDIMVLPSISNEDFPNVVIESMSLGKAVIATCIAGVPEQIEHGKTGLLVEPMDADGLADALSSVIHGKALRQSLGEQAQRAFSERFYATVAVQKYSGLYKSLLEEEHV